METVTTNLTPVQQDVHLFQAAEATLGTLPFSMLASAGIKSYHENHSEPIKSIREKTIQRAVELRGQVKPYQLMSVASIRCFQTALEETLRANGLDVALHDLFDILLSPKDATYATKVLIYYWFFKSTMMVNHALESGSPILRFGKHGEGRITLAAPENADQLLLQESDRSLFKFLSNVSDDSLFEKAKEASVRQAARDHILRFAHHVGWILDQAFGERAKEVFREVCVCFISGVAMLVLEYYEGEAKKVLNSPQ
jgi:hypothetical protein